ncbi:MAG: nucleoside 2-deoxyribosyltransferase [Acetobacteraceae bacterium]|nr:nucleoside 2-deoxyribosyltransferase [Acetobacteraceae bacterium]MDW8397997.1 nucleoside 2-deoxyribosyltransferase [Acetobacteraceae bacterium]
MRIYLAGPDVFLPDAARIAEAKKAICAAHGAEGVFPTDLGADHADDGTLPRWYSIYLRNEAHMRGCDAVVANLTPFRGPSADPGTVYELGFMRALGRALAGYSNVAAPFLARSLALPGAGLGADGRYRDADGLAIEDFGLTDNLMIDGGIRAAGGVLVVRDAPPGAMWTDLSAFAECVAALTRREPRPPAARRSPG